MIDELRLKYPVTGLCGLLDLSASGYYSWRDRPLSHRAQEDARLGVVIRAAHKRTRETCGPERLQQDIVAHDGVQVGVYRVKRIRTQLGLHNAQITQVQLADAIAEQAVA
jgi:putative transposase